MAKSTSLRGRSPGSSSGKTSGYSLTIGSDDKDTLGPLMYTTLAKILKYPGRAAY